MESIPVPVKEALAVLYVEDRSAYVAIKAYLRLRNCRAVAAEMRLSLPVVDNRVRRAKRFLADYIRNSIHGVECFDDLTDAGDDLIYYD